MKTSAPIPVFLLLLLAAFAAGGHCSAADAPPGKPEGNAPAAPAAPAAPLSVNLVINGIAPQIPAAVVTLLDQQGRPALPDPGHLFVNGNATLSLKPGSYTLSANGGLRTLPVTQVLRIAPGSAAATIQLQSYAPLSPAGWRMCAPFYNLQRAGKIPFPNLDALKLAAQCQGIEVLCANGLWDLRNAADKSYAAEENGTQQLRAALAAANDDGGCLLLDAWTAQRPGLGRFYAVEAAAQLSPQRFVPNDRLFPAFAALRDRGGLSVYCYPTGLRGGGQAAGELLFDTVAGPLYDLLDISRGEDDLQLWWTLLNQGYRIPATGGGSEADGQSASSDLPRPGLYLLLPRRKITPELFLRALGSGQSVVSNGPFLRLFVQHPDTPELTAAATAPPGTADPAQKNWVTGQVCAIGGTTLPSGKPRNLWLDAYACSDPQDDIRRIELIYNGAVLRHNNIPAGQKSLKILWENVVLDKSGWLVARYYSHSARFWAVTNPIYLADPGVAATAPAAAAGTLQVLDAGSGAPLPATVRAFLHEQPILTLSTEGREQSFRLPATAELEASAPGHLPVRLSLFCDGGPREYIDRLRRENRLSTALGEGASYAAMRKLLAQMRLTFRLPPARR